MRDAASQLRTATRRAKSDVANKLVSMFLHEFSRRICKDWKIRVDSEEYVNLVRSTFDNRCPYCERILATEAVVEHLDGLNRHRAGLHVPGNVVVACRRCNSEKRRDDTPKVPSLAQAGWESFLLHDGTRCVAECPICTYWAEVFPDPDERRRRLHHNLERIRRFRLGISEFQLVVHPLLGRLPDVLTKLYSDCQTFAAKEIASLLESIDKGESAEPTIGPTT